VDLKHLQLCIDPISSENLSLICELKNLETLNLDGDVSNRSDLNNLHKLKKLKGLKVTTSVSEHILEHLRFGVFNDLEELDASFLNGSVESVNEMKRITPNLKKVKISYCLPDCINALMENLKHLESLVLREVETWEMPDQDYPKLKNLRLWSDHEFKFSAEQITKAFPNLERLAIYGCTFEVTESSFVKLLSGLKQLKTLSINISIYDEPDSTFALPCFEEYGKHLEIVKVGVQKFDPENLDNDQGYKIVKKPNESFRLRQKFRFMEDEDPDHDFESD
jgi:hypothetical protein